MNTALTEFVVGGVRVSQHAQQRMQHRGIAGELIESVLQYGRAIYARGVLFRVVGKKEVARYAKRGVDLSRAEGVHVLVQEDGVVVTTYRNQDLRRIRPTKRQHRWHH